MSAPSANRLRGRYVLPSLICLLLIGGSASAHPRHQSIAEAEWNAKTGRLEVALRVNPIDLEQALRQRSNRPVDLDRSTGIDRLLLDYLSHALIVREADGARAKLVWVGHEVDLKYAWLYFEVPLETGPENATFSMGLFFDRLPDQAHTINFRVAGVRTSLTFTIDRLEAALKLPAED